MKKANVLSLNNQKVGEIDLPDAFEYIINKKLIQKAFLAEQSRNFQLKYTDPMAGKRKSSTLSKTRRTYKTVYGHGLTRTPKKVTWRMGTQFVYVGATAPNTVGGREAHPPKKEKVLEKKLNKKEKIAAIKSAIAASANRDIVKSSHEIGDIELPIVIEDKLNDISKTKELYKTLSAIGLESELIRTKKRIIRAGKGKMRGRKYKKKLGMIIITTEPDKLRRSAANMNIDVADVRKLNVSDVSHAGKPGRLIVWTQSAVASLKI
ncbi:MAG: 50S ribosomal protein L4 [Candidatus Parvarchaeota archaeon]|nr:50S ribosomal protein L4 [Candidatus Parvarchaeota archaeon]MCW1301539.1 50S ribosomal protein L4 [Candidatus Parvarchaeota archaeon]